MAAESQWEITHGKSFIKSPDATILLSGSTEILWRDPFKEGWHCEWRSYWIILNININKNMYLFLQRWDEISWQKWSPLWNVRCEFTKWSDLFKFIISLALNRGVWNTWENWDSTLSNTMVCISGRCYEISVLIWTEIWYPFSALKLVHAEWGIPAHLSF